jgi:hypothetical protein
MGGEVLREKHHAEGSGGEEGSGEGILMGDSSGKIYHRLKLAHQTK